MGLDMDQQTWSPYDEATTAEKDAAALYVASIATGPADCRELLNVLGLLPKRLRITEHGMAGYRQGCRCKGCRKANAGRTARQRARRASVPATTANCPTDTTTGVCDG